MKRTIIEYQCIENGRVKIVNVQNLATEKEIREELGDAVANEYFSGSPCYLEWPGRNLAYAASVKGWSFSGFFSIGYILDKDIFDELIDQMKIAGNRLSEIRKKHQPKPIRKIVI